MQDAANAAPLGDRRAGARGPRGAADAEDSGRGAPSAADYASEFATSEESFDSEDADWEKATKDPAFRNSKLQQYENDFKNGQRIRASFSVMDTGGTSAAGSRRTRKPRELRSPGDDTADARIRRGGRAPRTCPVDARPPRTAPDGRLLDSWQGLPERRGFTMR